MDDVFTVRNPKRRADRMSILRWLWDLVTKDMRDESYERVLDLLEAWNQQAAERGPNSVKIYQVDDQNWVVQVNHRKRRRSDRWLL